MVSDSVDGADRTIGPDPWCGADLLVRWSILLRVAGGDRVDDTGLRPKHCFFVAPHLGSEYGLWTDAGAE